MGELERVEQGRKNFQVWGSIHPPWRLLKEIQKYNKVYGGG